MVFESRLAPVVACLLLLPLRASLVAQEQTESNEGEVRSGVRENGLGGKTPGTLKRSLAMKKVVTDQASFVVYMPNEWIASESMANQQRALLIQDPSGLVRAAMECGMSNSRDATQIAAQLIQGFRTKFHDLKVTQAFASEDKKRVVFSGEYTEPGSVEEAFRCWVSIGNGAFTHSSIAAPKSKFTAETPLLLTILSNVRVIDGAFPESPLNAEVLVPHRLADGSASIDLPQGWRCIDLPAGSLIAHNANQDQLFIVSTAEVLSPELGGYVPGAMVSRYLSPHEALPLLSEQQRLARDIQVTEITPREDIAALIRMIYTVGPVTVEEFFFRYTAQGKVQRGYTFGVSLGTRLNTNWKFWHLTVAAPESEFDQHASTFVAMADSYRIDSEFAKTTIARGLARLRELQHITAEIVARNADEIYRMRQAVYEERRLSSDYIDYQRTNYIRGEQDWISSMEGGAIYHTDRWGTQNTDTGEFWGDKAYDYFHSTGGNPKYEEQMVPINSRELWERAVK